MRRGFRRAVLVLSLGLLPADAADAATKKPRADLVVSSVTSPPVTATPGASFAAIDRVRNRGRATAGSSTTRFFLSKDAKVGRGDMRLAEHRVSRLRAGKSLSRRVTLKVPTFAPAGIYRVLACADRRRQVAESSERNNCRAAQRRVSVMRVPLLGPGPAPIPGPSVPGGLSISPGTQVFSSTAVGSSSQAVTFTVTNTGQAPSGTLGTSLVGRDASQFAVSADGCAGKALPGGGTCTITAQFAPSSTGAKLAGLQVTGKPGGTVASEMTGLGLTPAKLGISPGNHSYGTVSSASPSEPTTFTITNTGEATSGSLTAALAGTSQSQFTISSNSCNGTTLAGGATCTMGVRFAPNSEGAKSASLEVSGTPGGKVSATLSGTGTLFTITPASHAFSDTALGATGASSQTFTIRNVGPTTANGVVVTPPDPAQFLTSSNNCTTSLASNAQCTVVISFRPTGDKGPKSGALQVTGSPGGTASASLTGKALTPANLTLQPTTQGFGVVPVNTRSAPIAFTVTNTGEAASGPVTPTVATTAPAASPAQFGGLTTTCPTAATGLAGGATCTVSVRFAPTSPGLKRGTLQVAAAPGTHVGGPRTATLDGEGTALTINPPNGNFTAAIGSTTGATQFTVTASSATPGPLVVNVTGTHFAQFAIASNTCGGGLAMGGSCTIGVTFSPTGTPGTRTAALEVTGGVGFNTRAPLTGTAT